MLRHGVNFQSAKVGNPEYRYDDGSHRTSWTPEFPINCRPDCRLV